MPERPGCAASTRFCYVNATPNEVQVGNPPDTQRLIRFVGDAPTQGATLWISCESPAP